MRPALIFILALACLAPSGLAARSTSASPFPGAYAVAGAVPGATFPEMLDMAMVPGAPDEAVVITQGGLLWRVSLSGAFAPYAFGDVRDRMTRQSDEGLLGVVFSPRGSYVLAVLTEGGQPEEAAAAIGRASRAAYDFVGR